MSALCRLRMPLFDSFYADIRIIHDVRNRLHIDMDLSIAKLSMNTRISIHAATSLVLTTSMRQQSRTCFSQLFKKYD